MRLAEDLKVPSLTIGLMLGKAVKLADGNLDTHSHKITLNKDFLCKIAMENGCSLKSISLIANLNIARELWKGLSEDDSERFFPAILRLCFEQCRVIFHGDLEAVLIDDDGKIRYRL